MTRNEMWRTVFVSFAVQLVSPCIRQLTVCLPVWLSSNTLVVLYTGPG